MLMIRKQSSLILFAWHRLAEVFLSLTCCIGLPLTAHAATHSLPMVLNDTYTSVEKTDLSTGDTTFVEDEPRGVSRTASSFLSLEPVLGFSGQPAAAKAISTEDGIVRGSINTGAKAFSATVISEWVGVFRVDSVDATFDFLISDAYLELFHYGSFSEFNDTDIRAEIDFSIGVATSLGGGIVEALRFQAAIAGRSRDLKIVVEDTGPLTSTYSTTVNSVGDILEARWEFDPYASSISVGNLPVGEFLIIFYDLILRASSTGGETEAGARFSDPADFGGGISTTISGLTPVVIPEPASAWLIGSGLLVLLGARRRRGA